MILPYETLLKIDEESEKILFLNNCDYATKYSYSICFSPEDLKRYRAYFVILNKKIFFHKISIIIDYNCNDFKKFVEEAKEMLKYKIIKKVRVCCCEIKFEREKFEDELSKRFNKFIYEKERIPSEREVKSLILEQLASYPSEEELLENLRKELDKIIAEVV